MCNFEYEFRLKGSSINSIGILIQRIKITAIVLVDYSIYLVNYSLNFRLVLVPQSLFSVFLLEVRIKRYPAAPASFFFDRLFKIRKRFRLEPDPLLKFSQPSL